jgi:REP element-mobilizing transposase RayT
MKYDPAKHHRKSIRLKGFDYSQNAAYFITLVTQGRECLFGEIIDGEMQLNAAGEIITLAWLGMEPRFPHVQLDEFVIMPNHFHAIISVGATLVVAPDVVAPDVVAPDVVAPDAVAPDAVAPDVVAGEQRAGTSPAPTNTNTVVKTALGDIVGAFKSIATHKYILAVRRGNLPPFAGKIWQRNYYEHIIRNERDWERIRRYIRVNPARWAADMESPITKPTAMDALNELATVCGSGKATEITENTID